MKNKGIEKNKTFYKSMALFILEGLLSGINFTIIFVIIKDVLDLNFNYNQILKYSSILALVYLIRNFSYRRAYTYGQYAGSDISRNIRLNLGNKFKEIPLFNFTKRKTGRYINTVTNDVDSYENILTHKYGDILKNLVLVIMLLTYLFKFNKNVGIVSLVGALLLIPSLYISFKIVNKHGKNKNLAQSDNTDNIVEYITGIKTLRIYGQDGVNNNIIINSMKNYSDVSFKYEINILPMAGIFNILIGLCIPVSIYIVGLSYINREIDIKTAIMISTLPIFLNKLLNTLYISLTGYKNLKISKNNIESIFNEKEELKNNKSFNPKVFDLKFENVDFSYDDSKKVCDKLSFKGENGKLTAIVGSSGAGKSTILNLISKLHVPDGGSIKIGGIDIEDISSEKILDKISMVDQNTFLFNDTIKNNIRIAKPTATDQEIIEVSKLSNCHDFIMEEKDGYNRLVGENGNRLSGGQRQRISIARALLKDNPIVLLDEATASLDIENELLVKKAIMNLISKNKTIFMVAHTLPIVKNADRILVMDNGKIIESGTHEDLMKLKGKYYSMYLADKSN
jgi:ATP-binding cassette subfamily B protein